MASKKRCSDQYASPISLIERWIYFVTTVCTIAYICYSVYRDSIRYDGILNHYDFDIGWSWVGKEQDISNFEWRFWYGMFWQVWPWYLGHAALGKIMEWNYPARRKHVFLIFSLISICRLMGWKPVILFLIHCSLMYVASLPGYTVLVWIISLGALSTLNFEPCISMMKLLVEDDEEETWYYLLMFTLALVNIKCTSFCLEKCWHSRSGSVAQGYGDSSDMYKELNVQTNEKKAEQNHAIGYSFIDELVYVFYLPLYFTGPILTFDCFRDQMNAPLPYNSGPHLKLQFLHLIRFCFWAMFNELILHFLYFNALQHSYTVLQSVSLFTLSGIGYLHGQFFMIKYLVMFGLPGTIAKFDYLDPPDGPKCISYIYLYSDMWKYFDRGLYSFLKRYIYVPCGGSQTSFHRQVIGSLLCFMYIFYWHGAQYYIMLWILLNYAGVSMEKIGALICSIPVVRHIEMFLREQSFTSVHFYKYQYFMLLFYGDNCHNDHFSDGDTVSWYCAIIMSVFKMETEVLSAGMVQRIHAFFSIPIFLLSCFSMFCFFGGKSVGYIFYRRLILEGSIGSFTVLAVLVYCAIQNAIEVNRWVHRREKMKQS